MSIQPAIHYTPEDYYNMERTAPLRHEYYQGQIFGMIGASRNHNLISGNIAAILHRQLRRRQDCESYVSDMRVKVSHTGLYAYPDIVLACNIPEFDDEHQDTLLNPQVIIEVLSESTEAYDRGKKFYHYRMLASLQVYVLVHQTSVQVEQFVRQPDNSWLFSEYSAPEDTLVLPDGGCTLTLADIYEKVRFTPIMDQAL